MNADEKQANQGNKEQEKKKAKSTAVNIFAILGFIALLIIGVWSTIQVVKFVPRLFEPTGVTEPTPPPSDTESIAVSLSKASVSSGEPVVVSWTRAGTQTGVLSFAYACTEDFSFAVANNILACNEPHTLPAGSSNITVVPLLEREGEASVSLAVTFTDAGGASIRDTKALRVKNDTLVLGDDAPNTGIYDEEPENIPPRTSVQPAPRPTATPAYPTADPYGVADFTVIVSAVGVINAYGAFEARTAQVHELGAVKFVVSNRGTKETGVWTFRATLPTVDSYTFTSKPQASLLPGGAVEMTVTFTQPAPGTRNFEVVVDPQNAIRELSDYNNSASQPFYTAVPGGEYYYPY